MYSRARARNVAFTDINRSLPALSRDDPATLLRAFSTPFPRLRVVASRPGRAHIFAITVIQARISMKIIGIVIGARGKRIFSGCRL